MICPLTWHGFRTIFKCYNKSFYRDTFFISCTSLFVFLIRNKSTRTLIYYIVDRQCQTQKIHSEIFSITRSPLVKISIKCSFSLLFLLTTILYNKKNIKYTVAWSFISYYYFIFSWWKLKTVFFTHSLRSFVKKLFSPPKRKIYIFTTPTVSLRLQYLKCTNFNIFFSKIHIVITV
jgi:hypothetical protein